MKPVDQTRFGGPGVPHDEAGNCFCACLASLFECGLEDTPDVAKANKGAVIIDDWLKEKGWEYIFLVPGQGEKTIYAPGYSIACVPSFKYGVDEEGFGLHVVVALNGQPIHNPNPHDPRPLEELDITSLYLLYPTNPERCFNV